MKEKGFCTYTNEDLAKFILRLTVAALMLFHGVAKVQHGIDWMMGALVANGVPGFVAYGVYLGEILAPIMLIVGYRVKLASLLVIITMVVAIWLAHPNDIFAITKHGAWAIELLMFYILSSIAIFFLGAGKYSLDKR
jgi:putative oxidoreductase